MTVTDDRGRRVSLERPPRRIVSLVPSITETIFALGAGERLVGVTRYCTHPAEARSLPRVGGTKNPDCDGIAAAKPDLVFVSEEENRIEDFQTLQAAGLALFVVFPKTIDAVVNWVSRLGDVLDRRAPADLLAATIVAAAEESRAALPAVHQQPRVFCPIWKRPWMSFNADTYTDAVLRVCGARNVCAEALDRYCRISLETVAGRAPDLVLLPDEPYPFGDKDIGEVRPLLQPFGTARATVLIDGRALSWYGARTPSGIRIIRSVIARYAMN